MEIIQNLKEFVCRGKKQEFIELELFQDVVRRRDVWLKLGFKPDEIVEGIRGDIKTELINVLNEFVETTSYDEDIVLDVIKEKAKKMPYLDYRSIYI